MIISHSPQGTPQWFEDRAGAITASMFAECRKRLKSGPNKGDYSSEAHAYAFRLAVERIKGAACDQDQYETYAMRRGKELEHDARMIHEERIGTFVEQGGFIMTDDRLFGFSADGFIGDDGLAEYKCFLDTTKVRKIMFEQSIEEVADQVQGGLWITGRKWCDSCLYYPDLESIGLNLIVNRVFRDDDYIAELETDLLAFNGLVMEYIEKINRLAEKQNKSSALAAFAANEAAGDPAAPTSIEDLF